MSARKSSHGTIFLIVSSGSPLALIASSLRSTSKKPFCPMTRSLHRPYPRAVTESDSRARGERNFSRRPKVDLDIGNSSVGGSSRCQLFCHPPMGATCLDRLGVDGTDQRTPPPTLLCQ